MSQATAVEKERVTVYLPPELSLALRMDRAQSKKTVSDIVEEIVRAHYDRSAQKSRKGAPV